MSQELSYEAEALGASLPPLLLDAERLASTVSLGVHGRRKAGMGESFWQFRRYHPEDAASSVDWRQSAKTQHLFVREREWEAAQSVWFWCDRSAGMQFGSQRQAKAHSAALLTLALASLLVRGGERVALYGSSAFPANSRIVLRRIAHALSESDPRVIPTDAPVTTNAEFVWASDFLSPLSAIESALHHLARFRVTGALVHIVDPAEEDFPFAGRTRFEDTTGKHSETIGRAESIASAYRTRFKAHVESIGLLARRLGWSHVIHRTDHPPQTALTALYIHMSGA